VSPYRPWVEGSLATVSLVSDFFTRTLVNSGTMVVTPRIQATGSNQELIVDNIVAAGVQASQSLEEVRPATRFPRRAAAGLLIDDSMRLACYTSVGTLCVTSAGMTSYSGSHIDTPSGGYTAQIDVVVLDAVYRLTAAGSVTDSRIWNYRYGVPILATGTYNFSTGTYAFNFGANVYDGTLVKATWTVTDTEVLRPEPSRAKKDALEFACQRRTGRRLSLAASGYRRRRGY
jgi:hypothetical protein